MNTIITGEKSDVEREGFDTFKEQSDKIIDEQGTCTVGICGGSSIKGMFHLFKNHPRSIDWKNIHIFLVDERRVPLDDPRSNFNQAYDEAFHHLVDHTQMTTENLHPYTHTEPITSYTEELNTYGGFDISFFGVGGDGHIAALFPHHTVDRDNPGFFTFDDSPKPPKKRMTLSKQMVKKTTVTYTLFFGKEKQKAYKAFQNSDLTASDVPAKLTLNTTNITLTNLEKD